MKIIDKLRRELKREKVKRGWGLCTVKVNMRVLIYEIVFEREGKNGWIYKRRREKVN